MSRMFKSGGRGYGTCSFFHENLEAVYYPDNCMPKKFLKRIPRNKSKNLRKKYKKEAIELIKYFNQKGWSLKEINGAIQMGNHTTKDGMIRWESLRHLADFLL